MKLKRQPQSLFENELSRLIKVEEFGYFMFDYLTLENLGIIKDAIQRFIEIHQGQIKLAKLKAVYQDQKKTQRACDDTLVGLMSQRSTQISEVV